MIVYRIISVVISICLVVMCITPVECNVLADEYNEYSSEMLTIATNILKDIGWWEDFNPDSPYLTRAETAVITCMRDRYYEYYKNRKPTKAPYKDVSVEHWASNFIDGAFTISIDGLSFIMEGDGNGFFRPDEYITYQEYIKTLVTSMGWAYLTYYIAPENEHYPSGFIKVADWLGIYPLDEGVMDQPIKKNDAIIILYNALKAPIWTMPGFCTIICLEQRGSFLEYESRKGSDYDTAIHHTKGYAIKTDDECFEIDGEVYHGKIKAENFSEGNVICLYNIIDEAETKSVVTCYPISSLNFDNPKPISEKLPYDTDEMRKMYK